MGVTKGDPNTHFKQKRNSEGHTLCTSSPIKMRSVTTENKNRLKWQSWSKRGNTNS